MKNEAAYWITLAHIPRWRHLVINNLIVKFFHEHKISIVDFFELSEADWKNVYELDEKQISELNQAKSELAGNAFLAESLLNQGYEIIPITSPEYSKTLKNNLKAAHSPAVLYLKGNKKILEEKSIAIVGSRAASEVALQFTDNIAKKASKDYKVVVSGFAKGVDKQALDSALDYKGQSIIVLPQGITTFGSGFKKYYKQIVDGDVLVLSVFPPKAGWSAGLAMARNPIIYGLANEIYVAESSDKGGTWSGVLDGLRKGRKIFVRIPEETENNANDIMIQKGAIPVDFNGDEVVEYDERALSGELMMAREPKESTELDDKIRSVFNGHSLTVNELLNKLDLDWSVQKLNTYLRKLEFVEISKEKGKDVFNLKGIKRITQTSLFD